MSSGSSVPPPSSPRARPVRLIALAVMVLAGAAVIGLAWHQGLSPVSLLERRVAIDAFVGAHRIAALLAFTGIYAVVVALSLPGAALLTICGGIIFGGPAGRLAALVRATAAAAALLLGPERA